MRTTIYRHVKNYYSNVYCGRLSPSVEITSGISLARTLGYASDFLEQLNLYNFPFEKIYPCGSVVDYIDVCTPMRILNLGSGVGLDGLYVLHKAGKRRSSVEVVNLDVVYSILKKGRQWSNNFLTLNFSKLKWVCGNGYMLPFVDNSFKYVLINGSFNLFENKELLLREVRRVMLRGGFVLIADILANESVPIYIRHNLDAWVWNMAGALSFEKIKEVCCKVGFGMVSLLDAQEIINSLFYRAILRIGF